MPDISLKDNLDLNIDVEPGKDSAIAKYFKSGLTFLNPDGKLRQYAPLSLADPAFSSLHAALNVAQPLAVVADGLSLTLKAGASAGIDVFVPDPHAGETDSLFSPDNYGEDVPVKQTERYVSVSLIANAGHAASAGVSDIEFGFAADSSVTITNYQKFSVGPESPALLNAIKQTLASFQIPASVADLAAMLPDSIVTVAGAGTLTFSGSANLLAVSNPLAVAELPGAFGTIAISEGASFRVGASFRLFGDYELRARKTSTGKVRFGYFKEHGKEWKASASASAGLSLSFDGNDLLGQVISALSPAAEADFDELKNAGLDTTTVESIQATVKTAIERTLEIGASYELGCLSARQAAFLYEVDLGALDQDGETAVSRALRGDLSALGGANDDALPRGITMIHSVFTNLRQAKRTFKVNLLGIYNFISLSKLTAKGKVLFDPESGELILSDSATATKIQAAAVNVGRPNHADPNALRKVMASSLLITAAYRASQTLVNSPALKSSHVYCELHDQTSRDTMADELGIAVALGLMTRTELDQCLDGAVQFGRTIAYVSADYNDSLATALFLQNDQPRALTEYEDIGRYAMQAVVTRGGVGDPVRLRPLQSDDLWKQMKAAGQSNFHALLPGATDLQVGAVAADFSTITWWADTMSETAQALAKIRNFLGKNPAVDPKNAEFQKVRSDLAQRLERVAAETKEEFGRPWGLIAMDLLTGNRSDAHVTFTGPVISLTKARPIAAAAAGRQMI